MKVAVISPHLDDAIFSVAENMLSRTDWDFTIICPLAGIPDDEAGAHKYNLLTIEHVLACSRHRWAIINGPFLDDVYGPQDAGDLHAWLVSALNDQEVDFDAVWMPLGIHHPDHQIVAAAAFAAVISGGSPWTAWIYEELPYRVLYPAETAAFFLGAIGPVPEGYDPAWLETKKVLCRTYASQIGPDLERCLYVPERLWRVS